MLRLAAAIVLSSLAFAQTVQETEPAVAAKSPFTLARYVESHSTVDWKALRSTLGLKEVEHWLAPCPGDCTTEVANVLNPDQAIVIIRGGGFSYTVEYLRYLQDSKGGWQFAGEYTAFFRNRSSNHEVVRIGAKPYLKISSDFSQNGGGLIQEIEDWFDLTQPDFAPAFSLTVAGGVKHFGGFDWGRTIQAQGRASEDAGVERIDVYIYVNFLGTGLDFPAKFSGVYLRSSTEKKFTLRSASLGLGQGRPIPTKDFEDLNNPFAAGPSDERFLVYALDGLKQIDSGSDAEPKNWLRSVLDHTDETPEKRTLLELLAKPSARQ